MMMQSAIAGLGCVFCGCALAAAAPDSPAETRLKALLVTGHDRHGHEWVRTTPILERVLKTVGRFDVEVVRLPSRRKASAFAGDFRRYDVVVVYAHGHDWSRQTRAAFEEYLRGGGGLVVVHNAVGQWTDWPAYRAMIGIGPGKRDDGFRLKYDEGQRTMVRVPPGQGVGRNGHGRQHEWLVTIRRPEHPVVAGLPDAWLHTTDELYHGFRGKPRDIKHLKVLATAFSAKNTGGTGAHEPVLMVNSFGKGRVFHTTLGHGPVAMSCIGFRTVFLRGAEWAATGSVSRAAVPEGFPTERKSSAANQKIVLIGGCDTHGIGAHDHKGGAKLMRQWIDALEHVKGIETALYLDKLPDDLSELDGAAAFVLMWEGWDKHLLHPSNAKTMKKFEALMAGGAGLVCLHAATAVSDSVEPQFLRWAGGNKKKGYSTHPMAKDVAAAIVSPAHPVCRGVKGTKFPREEFYRKILFAKTGGKVTPILEAVPAIGRPQDQTIAWVFERSDGGRSFCCTGPHFHTSFSNEHFRQLVLNAIVWTAHRPIPAAGVD